MSDQIVVLYFASLREQLGCEREDLELTGGLRTGSTQGELASGFRWFGNHLVRRQPANGER